MSLPSDIGGAELTIEAELDEEATVDMLVVALLLCWLGEVAEEDDVVVDDCEELTICEAVTEVVYVSVVIEVTCESVAVQDVVYPEYHETDPPAVCGSFMISGSLEGPSIAIRALDVFGQPHLKVGHCLFGSLFGLLLQHVHESGIPASVSLQTTSSNASPTHVRSVTRSAELLQKRCGDYYSPSRISQDNSGLGNLDLCNQRNMSRCLRKMSVYTSRQMGSETPTVSTSVST